MSRTPRIELHIDRIAIDAALLAGERPRDVEGAMTRELERLLATAPARDLTNLGQIDAAWAQHLPAARPGLSLGERIATAIHSSLIAPSPTHRK